MKNRPPRKWPSVNRKRYKNMLYRNQGAACRDCGKYKSIDQLHFRKNEDGDFHHLICGGCFR